MIRDAGSKVYAQPALVVRTFARVKALCYRNGSWGDCISVADLGEILLFFKPTALQITAIVSEGLICLTVACLQLSSLLLK